MLLRIREFLAPPVFPDDDEKTLSAKVLNIILLGFLLVLGGAAIAVLLLFVEKLYSFLIILGFLLVVAISYLLMRHGRVRLASSMFITALWIIGTIFVSLAGGMISIAAVFYLTGAVMTGLLLGYPNSQLSL